ncbi:MAG: patatin-like phospholipase family protein [Cyclobacteriaceae bacterium]|nr:patatin-like phospholipase family protein [Cyclobacteriaceae bacterium]
MDLTYNNHFLRTGKIKTFFFIGLCCLITANSFGQQQRPKVGLVLSGGGAKGIAHIGILAAMEEAGLTPDYITGTSMGSIVGGLYAAGYSAAELKALVKRLDWGELLSNRIPFDKVTFEEKPYYGRYLLDFYVKGKKLQLPKGIIEGQGLMELFSSLTRPVHGITDFNNLPIPFACVGSNIVTGEPLLLNKGSLAMSMRASMAIPSIFTPVRIDDHLLVDGGLLRNMPVSEVIDMGADIIIGVFVSNDLDPEENLTSAVSILSQAAFITSAMDSRQQLAMCNVLIQPNLDGFATGSFNMASQILERGEEAGKAYVEIFRHLADSLRQFGPPRTVVKPVIQNEYIFDDVQVEGTDVIEKEFVLGKLQVKTGTSVSIDHIEERIRLIYGTLYFEKIWYEILGPKGHRILKISVVEHPRSQLRFSYHYDSENKGGIIANATLRNVLLKRSRLILEADLASYPRVTIDYFKYVGKNQNVALQTTGVYLKNELPAYDSIGNLNSLFSTNYATAGLRLQTTKFQSSAFGVEAKLSYMGLKPKIADEFLRSISKIQYSSTAFSLYYQFDNMNDRYFPTKGFKSEIRLSKTTRSSGKAEFGDTLTIRDEELGELLFTSSISAADVMILPIIPLNQRLSLLGKMRLRLSNLPANTLNLGDYDFIGGFTPGVINANEYLGVGTREFGLANYFYAKLGLQYKVRNNLYLQGIFNYLDAEHPVTWIYPNADVGKLGDRYSRFGYGGAVGFSSPIGPISFSFAKDHYRERWRASLMIGFTY